MTDHLLDGLDWNNVFVAGGLVLGTFLTPQVPNEGVHHRNEWQSSDIDMYVYGVSVQAANDQIKTSPRFTNATFLQIAVPDRAEFANDYPLLVMAQETRPNRLETREEFTRSTSEF